MLHIYFEIRYYNQLMKIAPRIVTGISENIEQTVHGNGGVSVSKTHPYIFQFNTDEIGATLGAARTIDFMTRLLEKNKRRISEYTILCETADTSFDFAAEAERSVNTITSDTGCFCTYNVYQILRHYMECTRSDENGEWYQTGSFLNPVIQPCQTSGSTFVISAKALESIFNTAETPHIQQYALESGSYSYNIPEDSPVLPVHIYPSVQNIPFRSLREMLEYLPCPINDVCRTLSKQDTALFTEIQNVITEYDCVRFEHNPNPIFVQTLYAFFQLFFRALDRYAENCGKTVAFFVHSAQLLDRDSLALLSTAFGTETTYTHSYLFLMKDKDSDASRTSEYRTALMSRISSLPNDLRNMFYLVAKSSEYLFSHEIKSFFGFLGKESSYLDAVCTVFAGYGLLEDKNDIRSVIKDIRISGLQCDISNIESTIARYLQALFMEQKLRAGIELYKILLTLGFTPALPFAENAVLKSYERRTLCDRELQLSKEYLVRCGVDSESASLIHGMYSGFCALEKGDRAQATSLFDDAHYVFGAAVSCFSDTMYDRSLQYAKKALQHYQDIKDQAGESRALQLLGNIYFAEKRFADAQDYLTYALHGNAIYIDNVRKLTIYSDLLAVTYMTGRYSETLQICNEMYDVAVRTQTVEKQLEVLFVKGRCLQACGRYQESDDAFDKGLSCAEYYKTAGTIPENYAADLESCTVLFRLWKHRSAMYQGRTKESYTFFASYAGTIPDAVLFMAEAIAITGGDPLDADTISSAHHLIQQTALQPVETARWITGFSLLENRAFTGSDLIPAKLFDIFIMYRNAAISEHKNESIAAIYAIVRAAESLKLDPYASLYYYIYYRCLPNEVDAQSIDRVTILGRAFKCMQVISANISDIFTARDYMSKAYWNSCIMEDAKMHMLF